jgi:hypothetical protein
LHGFDTEIEREQREQEAPCWKLWLQPRTRESRAVRQAKRGCDNVRDELIRRRHPSTNERENYRGQ